MAIKYTHLSDTHKKRLSEVHTGNSHNKGKHHTEETKRKLSLIHKGKPKSEEWKRKIGESNKGKIISDETKNKLRLANLGKHHTKETKFKMSEKHRGKKFTDEWRKKIGDAQRGKIHLSMEARKIISELLKGKPSWNKGKHCSEETKRKLSKANLKYGKKISWMMHTSKRRILGYNCLNNYFNYSEAHHIDKDNVVFIPCILHRNIRHILNKPETMYNINLMTIYWLIYTHQIDFNEKHNEQILLPQITR